MDVRCRLHVDRDAVGARLDEVLHLALGPLDHQVHVDDRAGGVDLLRERLHGVRAEGDRRHEVAVHHIDVNHACPGSEHLRHLRAEPREVRRQDRGRDLMRTDAFGVAHARAPVTEP